MLKDQKVFFVLFFFNEPFDADVYLLCDIPFIFCIWYGPLTVRVEFAVAFPLRFQGFENDQM